MLRGFAELPSCGESPDVLGLKRARMRAIHAPSRSVIRLNAGLGYSAFHSSGSKLRDVEKPKSSHPGARAAIPRPGRRYRASRSREPVAPVEHVRVFRAASKWAPSPTRPPRTRSYRVDSARRGRATRRARPSASVIQVSSEFSSRASQRSSQAASDAHRRGARGDPRGDRRRSGSSPRVPLVAGGPERDTRDPRGRLRRAEPAALRGSREDLVERTLRRTG